MVRSTQPPERSSFALTLDGGAPEELLKAGKYDWVSDYARQIVDSKFCAPREAENEIELLAPLRRSSDEGGTSRDLMNLADVLTRYDPPEVGDVLRFGAQYPMNNARRRSFFRTSSGLVHTAHLSFLSCGQTRIKCVALATHLTQGC
jgi:hypothetical protein